MRTFTLPASDKPWQFVAYGGAIVFINENHPPMFYADGILDVIGNIPPELDPMPIPEFGPTKPPKSFSEGWPYE